ncbi:MAG TPA: YetF domain-containing protein [Devosia sp.]|nr:YetF domain-containing protein [Devosia sp.]
METVIRGAAIYGILLIVMRLSGRRTLAQMTPFDLVLLLIVAETTQQAMLTDDYSLTNALVLIVTLFTLDIVLSQIKRRSERAQLILEGTATVLISHGQCDEYALRRARVELEEVLESAREQGIERLDQIKFAILEVGGTVSIIPESAKPTDRDAEKQL